MYHNIQNNIYDYQKLKNFKYIFWFEKVFLMYMCGKFFHVTIHMSSRLKIILKNMFVCVYTNTQHRTYKKYQIIRIIMILYA